MSAYAWSQIVERPPAAALRGLIRRYTGYEEWSGRPLRRTEVPSGDVSLIVSLGPAIDVLDPGGRLARHTSFVAPLHDAPATTEFAGAQRGVQIRLAPPAARALLGVPLGELANTVVTLEDLLGRAAGELVERLNEASDWEARFALLDGVLASRPADARRPA